MTSDLIDPFLPSSILSTEETHIWVEVWDTTLKYSFAVSASRNFSKMILDRLLQCVTYFHLFQTNIALVHFYC